MIKQSARLSALKIYGICLLISAALLTVCTKSSFLYPLNDWVDVNIYFTIGKGMFAGRVPYLDLYDQKGPVVYLVYGLCSLLSGQSFLGVWLLEVLTFSAFLYTAYKLLSLYVERNALLALPVLATLILSSMSISHGGSLEEICLPIFGYSLYCAVRYFKVDAPNNKRPKLSMLFINGLLAGLLLFSKFNLLSFHFAWMAILAITLFVRHDVRYGLACCGVFVGGMLLVGVPWIIYFAAHGALPEFWHYYFYSNMFGYSYLEPPVLPNMLLAIGKSTLATFYRNIQYTLLIVLGFAYITCCRGACAKRIEKINLWLLAILMACGAFMGGQGYRYYGIPLAVFATLGFVPLLRLWNAHVAPRLASKRWVWALPAALTALGVCAALLLSTNTYLLGIPKDETPQYCFANEMQTRKTEDSITLLCRAFPDSGFYLAADVIPTCRFFTSTNVPLQEVADEQVRFLNEKIPEFAITRDRKEPPADGYALLDQASLFYEDDVSIYRLYQRTEKERDTHANP
ncbi:MAG: hypothetical protein RR224_07085 [Clostridia bacterium]